MTNNELIASLGYDPYIEQTEDRRERYLKYGYLEEDEEEARMLWRSDEEEEEE